MNINIEQKTLLRLMKFFPIIIIIIVIIIIISGHKQPSSRVEEETESYKIIYESTYDAYTVELKSNIYNKSDEEIIQYLTEVNQTIKQLQEEGKKVYYDIPGALMGKLEFQEVDWDKWQKTQQEIEEKSKNAGHGEGEGSE